MLINFSNHPCNKWGAKQINAAKAEFGTVVDLPFPIVDPEGTAGYIDKLAQEYVAQIVNIGTPDKCAVHIMGELNLSFSLLKKLQDLGYVCVAATTNRLVVEISPNEKEVKFDFVQFRRY